MGKHYALEFQLQVLQPILKGKMGIREAARFYNIPSGTLETFWKNMENVEKNMLKSET